MAVKASSGWRAMTAGLPRLRMPAFSRAMPASDESEKLDMVDRDRRDDRAKGMIDDVGGVEPPAEADLEQQVVGRDLGKEQERRRRGDLEKGDRPAGIDRLAPESAALSRRLDTSVPARRMRSRKWTRSGEV